MTHKTLTFLASALVAFSMSGGVAFAETTVSDSSPKDAPSASAKAALQQASSGSCNQGCMNIIKAYGTGLIDTRLMDLADRDTHIQAMARLSANQKAALSANIQTNVNALNTLKTKINADTDMAVLVTDIRSITKDYRIYLLILPQLRASAAAYRMQAVYDMHTDLAAKLQARIDHAASTTVKANAQAALDDMKAKVADAKTQTDAAVTEVINLVPDKGVQATIDSNKAAVTDAKSKLSVAQSDMVSVQTDIATVRSLLKY